MAYNLTTEVRTAPGDLHTPVALYLKLRDRFPNSLLLESSEYQRRENSLSYLCLQPMAQFEADLNEINIQFPDGGTQCFTTQNTSVSDALHDFCTQFVVEPNTYAFTTQGLFGYTAYDAIPLFEPIQLQHPPMDVPLIHYQLFRFLLVFDHFKNVLYFVENRLENSPSELDALQELLVNPTVATFPFRTVGEEQSNGTDEAFLTTIEKGKAHCYRGDVFQIVLSRQFEQAFQGDDFNVYRALRSVNPSPYLFYFDYGSFKIMGSSPEAQLTIQQQKATVFPIAGTFRRTGNPEEDQKLASALREDPKENAEHTMLVDLARNDLHKQCSNVQVDRYKSIEFYSHVIHMTSEVSGQLAPDYQPLAVLGATYPAGTLSGAPKHRAMELIDELEPNSRGFYGGTVGVLGLDGTLNHAIFIRSIVSRNNTLTYQAGCGVVIHSDPQMELQEVNHKLNAVRTAIQKATQFAL